jgi:FKBP-type peptidyl-prolyl cis-trans isomerase
MDRLMKRFLLLFGALSLAACLDVTQPPGSNPAFETFAPSLGVDLSDPAWKQTALGTYYKDEVVGTGESLVISSAQDSIFVDYAGYLKDGTNFSGPTQALRRLATEVITGFVDGMVDMRVGGTRLVVVPSNLGYGNVSNGPIPPNSTLVFRIKLNGFYNFD